MRKMTKIAAVVVVSAMVCAAAFAPGAARAEGGLKALNMFGDMVGAMADVAASQQEAQAAAAPAPAEKCWTEKRSTKSAGKTVVKTVKVCE